MNPQEDIAVKSCACLGASTCQCSLKAFERECWKQFSYSATSLEQASLESSVIQKSHPTKKSFTICHWLKGSCKRKVFVSIDDCDAMPDAKVGATADEVDSVLSHRGHIHQDEVGLRLKTQFMAEFDGVQTSSKHIVLIAATNRPQELDAAVRYDHKQAFQTFLGHFRCSLKTCSRS